MAVIANLTVKLQAQIAEFQSEFREATRSAEKFQSEFQGIATKASAFGNIIANGVTAAVGGLKSLAISVLDNASNIVDLSNKTGLAMRTVQEFQHVAEQTGTTVDAFTNAAFKLGTNLAGGSKSVVAGVTALGLSFKELQAQSPDEQFNQIAEALGRMEDPQERNRIALELFGRAAKDVLPAIAEGYRTMADAAAVAGDAQLRVLDALGDAWAKFVRDSQTNAAQFAGSLVLAGKAIREGGFLDAIKLGLATGDPLKGLVALGTQFGAVEAAANKAAEGNKKVGKSLTDMLADLDKSTAAQKRAQSTTDAYANSVKTLADRLSGAALTGEVRKLTDAFNSLSESQRTTPVVMERTAAAALDLFNAGAKLTPELFNIVIEAGRLGDLLPKVNVGMDGLAGVGRDVTREINAANQAIIDMAEIMNSVKFTQGLKGLELPEGIFNLTIPEPLPPTFWQEFLGLQGPTLAESARFAADSLVGALSDAIVTGDWDQFKASLRDTFAQFAGSALAAGVNLLVPGLGTLLQPLFSALADKFDGLFDRNRGRDLVEAFAESLGGFDALQARFAEMGAEGDRLWRLLTQGVGRNNPDQARRAIEEVTRALAAQEQKQKEAGDAAVEAARKIKDSQDAATSALRGRLSELSAEYDRLFDSIKNEAPEEVMGVIESQTRERMAAIREEQVETQNALERVLQSLEDSFAGIGQAAIDAARVIQNAFNGITPPNFSTGGSGGGGSSAPSVSFDGNTGTTTFAPTGSMPSPTTSTTTVILEMDSYQVAEAVVPQIPGVVQRYGLAGA
jgi:hypothetical protein